LKLKDKGDYERALNAMLPLWKGIGERPDVDGLHPSVSAEVLLCVGILICWVSNKYQLIEAQESAKDLITQSVNYYESVGDAKKIAAARSELAYCYCSSGQLSEARIVFTEALEKLTVEGNTRARALLGLAVVEWTAAQYCEALKILTENASLFSRINNHAIRASYHNQLALVLRNLSESERRQEYLVQAIREYKQADFHLKLAHNRDFRAHLNNNLGFLLYKLSRLKEAHDYLEEARRLASRIRNKVRTAQIDDTRAQVFIAEKKYKDAAAVARNAVRVLEKSGHQCLLTDALITQGTALARLQQTDHAQFIFQKAIEVAHQVGALNKAGLAALTLIEELETLPADSLYVAYDRAIEWLAQSQSQDLWLRLNAAGRKVCLRLLQETNSENVAEDPIEAILNKPCDLQSEVLNYEGILIKRALAKANGSLTRAAAMLSMSYQALAYILESRQKNLMTERSPVRRRSRKETSAEAGAEIDAEGSVESKVETSAADSVETGAENVEVSADGSVETSAHDGVMTSGEDSVAASEQS
jgi:tetratricopeptide (TPR) repeat protein